MLKRMWKRNYFVLGGAVLTVAALAFAATMRLDRPNTFTVPGDTAIHVRLDQTLSSNQSRPGDHFEATLSQPIVVGDKTIIPEGAPVEGLVVDAQHSGRLKDTARLELALESVRVNGKSYEIHTGSHTLVGGKHKKRNLEWIGGGAGGGALIGAAAGGGEGALIGGPIGAGLGTVAAMFTGRKDVRLPAETRLTFDLTEPLKINAKS